MVAPSIYCYLDYRAFLRDWFAAKQAADPRFSKRRFARLAGRSSPGLLTEVMEGKRQLTPPMIDVFARALDLGRSETEFFEALVLLAQSATNQARNHAWERISNVRAIQESSKNDGE